MDTTAEPGSIVAITLKDGHVITGVYTGRTNGNVSVRVRGIKVKVPSDEIQHIRHRVTES